MHEQHFVQEMEIKHHNIMSESMLHVENYLENNAHKHVAINILHYYILGFINIRRITFYIVDNRRCLNYGGFSAISYRPTSLNTYACEYESQRLWFYVKKCFLSYSFPSSNQSINKKIYIFN
jgi:hypothetical protein